MLIINQNNNLFIGYDLAVILLEVFPISFVIVKVFLKCKGKKEFYDLLIHAGLLQGIIAISSFIVPDIQMWVINRMIGYGFRDIIMSMADHRMYGFGYNFAYTLPIVQSFLAVLTIYLSINKNIFYILYTPILIFSAIINARASIVVLLIGLILISINVFEKNLKSIFKYFAIFGILISASFLTLMYIKEIASNTYSWIMVGGGEIIDILTGDFSGSYSSYITDPSTYKIPDNISLIFGTSERVIRGNYKYQSDVGFINDLWLGGMIYIILLYSYFLHKIIRIQKKVSKHFRVGFIVSLFLFLVLIAVNFKGIIFKQNEFINLFFLIYIYSLSLNNKSHDFK
jgi:hypothetical protein